MASKKQPELFGRVKSLLTIKSDGLNRDGPSRAKIEPKKKDEKIAADKAKPKKAKAKTNNKELSSNKSSEKSEKKKSTKMTEDTQPTKDPQPNQDKIEKRKPELYPDTEDLLTPLEKLEKQKKEAYDLAKLEMLTGGFLDTAALESNAALLALLLKQATNDGFFWTVVALVVVAVCLQVAIGVILAFRFRSTLDMEEGGLSPSKKTGCFDRLDASCWCSPKVLLFFAAVLLMILNVVNMFIIAFAGQVSDQEETAGAVEAGTPEIQ